MLKLLLVLGFNWSVLILSAQHFNFSENCEKAYNNIIALKLDSGQYYLSLEENADPGNLIPVLLKNYKAFLEIYTINADAEYKLRKPDFEARLKELRKGSNDSPFYLYAQAEVHLQAAVLHIKFGEYFAALMDVKKSMNKLEDNQEKYPDFTPNLKSLGTLNTILGSIPAQYQSGLSLFGLKGSVNEGMSLLRIAVDDNASVFQHESATIYAFLQLHISNNSEVAWQILQTNNFFDSESLMDAYTIAHIGIHGKYNDEGIAALQSRPKGEEYVDFPYLDFLLALGKTYKQDADANDYFTSFLATNQGLDYVKSTYHKMAWNALIQQDETAYQNFISKIGGAGRNVLDTDKQAQKAFDNQQTPHPLLLKARLFTDGGYLNTARTLLESQVVNEFKERHYKTEYFYRLARVYDKLGQFSLAKQYYNLTIDNGTSVRYYYAANAAYQMGYLYEEEGSLENATSYYELAVSLDGYEYDNSIDQKAKAGINRIKYNK